MLFIIYMMLLVLILYILLIIFKNKITNDLNIYNGFYIFMLFIFLYYYSNYIL